MTRILKKILKITLCLTILIAVVIFCVVKCWCEEQISRSRIERITGVDFPRYEIVDVFYSYWGFTGDYNDIYSVKFDEIPPKTFYDNLDELCKDENSSWEKEGNEYHYDIMWGNGFEPPKGESESSDGFIEISLAKDSLLFTITVGSW